MTSSKYWDIVQNYLNWTHLRPNSRPSQKKNELSDVFTQARSQVLRFGGENTFLGGQHFCLYCIKQIFLWTRKFGENKKICRALPPNVPLPWRRACIYMVQKTSNRHIQAVMNNLKFITLDYLAATKPGVLDWHRFLQLVHKQWLRHVTEYNTLGDNAPHTHAQYWSIDWNRGAVARRESYVQREMLCPCVT